MKHIFLNLKSFVKNEKIIFVLILICVIFSSFIINLSYGVFYNFTVKKGEAENALKSICPQKIGMKELYGGAIQVEGPLDIEGLYKSDFVEFVKALEKETLDRLDFFLLYCPIEGLSDFEGTNIADIRFSYNDGVFSVAQTFKEAVEASKTNLLIGRYFTDEEVSEGASVAFVDTERSRREDNKHIWVDKDTIKLFGREFKVVGERNGVSGAVEIPFTALPDSQQIVSVRLVFKRNITRSIYEDLKLKTMMCIPGTLTFPELEGIDVDNVALYNNMIAISFWIALLSVFNFVLLYGFVMKKRQRQLAIMRICGCNKAKAVLIYFGECVVLTVPSYIIGVFTNMLLTDLVLNKKYEYISEAYSPSVYITIASVYAVVSVVTVLIMIIKNVNHTITEEWRA